MQSNVQDAFDRIRAVCVCVSSGLCVRMYRVCSNACIQECVCVIGRCVKQTQVSSNAAPCLRSNAKGAFERRVQNFYFYFFTNIFTK
jgi:hypothetical protein